MFIFQLPFDLFLFVLSLSGSLYFIIGCPYDTISFCIIHFASAFL
jgi:hypothetical protein